MSGLGSKFVRVILVPAAVFQGVVFGGAYGTGREIAQFISSLGPQGGLLALTVVALGFGVVISLSFELARIAHTYDYRGFIKSLIGRGWILFEILFLFSLLVVLAVNGSAAGSILHDQFGIPNMVGVAALFATVVALNYYGRSLLQSSMAICMIALLTVLVIYCGFTFYQYHDAIAEVFSQDIPTGSWFANGAQFMLYSIAIVPVLLYSARKIHTRGEAIASGFSAGLMGAFPALVFHFSFMAIYPDSLTQDLPTYWMIGQLEHPWLMVVYLIVLFAMIIQTAAGLLQGVNERLDSWLRELSGKPCSSKTHALVSFSALAISLAMASVGITSLVADGYGNLAWGYLVIYLIPLLTVGVYKIARHRSSQL